MKIWVQICLEPTTIRTIDGKHTIVLYLSNERISLNAKTRSGIVEALLRLGTQVFGVCAPVNKVVIQTIEDLDGKSLSQSTVNKLKRKKRSTPHLDFREIIK